ncbi:hypothetical protein FA95DRAFT_883405 [Auriscalpium vulgare]|uniref:Uncharacterized protein n=1 Tax=Auriscalpium vulgare TaxID=40419 RepID=A0ACB8R8C2_9AGAM|nr:hypothetical protein FA95DRAFT_883405 [Auriscalpium vulgare]
MNVNTQASERVLYHCICTACGRRNLKWPTARQAFSSSQHGVPQATAPYSSMAGPRDASLGPGGLGAAVSSTYRQPAASLARYDDRGGASGAQPTPKSPNDPALRKKGCLSGREADPVFRLAATRHTQRGYLRSYGSIDLASVSESCDGQRARSPAAHVQRSASRASARKALGSIACPEMRDGAQKRTISCTCALPSDTQDTSLRHLAGVSTAGFLGHSARS